MKTIGSANAATDKAQVDEIDVSVLYQWIFDLICLTNTLSTKYDKWYQQLFYIKLIGLLEFWIKKKKPNLADRIDDYLPCFPSFMEKVMDALSDEEFTYIVYRRHTVGHIFLNAYDLIEGSKTDSATVLTKMGNISSTKESIDVAINQVLTYVNNDEQKYERLLVLKLQPIINEMGKDFIPKLMASHVLGDYIKEQMLHNIHFC